MTETTLVRSSGQVRFPRRQFLVRLNYYIDLAPEYEALAQKHIEGKPVIFCGQYELHVWVPSTVSMKRALYLARQKGRQQAIRQLRYEYKQHIYTQDTEAFLRYDPNDRPR